MTNQRNNVPCRCSAGMRAADGCGCRSGAAYERAECHKNLPVMVFIEMQEWDCVYPEERALTQGTLFPVLDKPFFGKGGCCCG